MRLGCALYDGLLHALMVLGETLTHSTIDSTHLKQDADKLNKRNIVRVRILEALCNCRFILEIYYSF